MGLPLVRNSGSGVTHVPNSEAISKAMATSTTPEAADYLMTQIKEIFSRHKNLDESIVQNVMETVQDYVGYVKLANQSGDEWAGIVPRSGFQNYQEGLAAISAKIIQDKSVELDYAISDDSQYLRGYSSNGVPLDTASSDAMDKCFNAWLAKNDLFSKGGVIYASTSNGEIKMEGDKPVKANAEDFRKLIEDPQRGFGQYLSRTNKSVKLSMQSQSFQTSAAPAATSPDESISPE